MLRKSEQVPASYYPAYCATTRDSVQCNRNYGHFATEQECCVPQSQVDVASGAMATPFADGYVDICRLSEACAACVHQLRSAGIPPLPNETRACAHTE